MKLKLTFFTLVTVFAATGQIGTFDPTFNDSSDYQIQNWASTGKIVSLTNETALNLSNYGVPGMPGNPGEEHALIGKLTNDLVANYASAQGIVNPGFNDQFSALTDFIVTADNKIIVTGYRQYDEFSYSSIYVGRYNSNGTFDNTFNSGSFYELDFSTSFYNTEATKVLLLSSGKIMCIAKRANSTNMLIRLNSDGTIDNAFGTNGIYDWNFMGGSYSKIHDAIELSSGKLLVAGSEYDGSNGNIQTSFVARMNADGTIDNTFGTGGLVKIMLGQFNKNSYINSIALTSTGEIIAAGLGAFTASPWDIYRGGIVKLSADGVMDNTFGLYTLPGDYSGLNKVMVTASNEIIAGGYSNNATVSSYAFVFLSLAGIPNVSIDDDGIVLSSNLPRAEIRDFTFQQDGKLIYVASSYVDNFNTGLHVGRLLMSENSNSLESNEINELSVFPNPTKENLSIQVKEPTRIRVLNVNGIELYTSELVSETTINVSAFAPGIYYIQTAEGQTSKFIKE
jgi:uncharacterized delta-60 repeat protein